MNLRSLFEQTRTPVARKRSLGAVGHWLTWDPARVRAVVYTVLTVATVAVAVALFRGTMWVQEAQYDAQVAAYNASTATPTTTAPALPEETAAAITPAPLVPATTRPAPSATVDDDVEAPPRRAAARFLTAYTYGPKAPTQKAWLDRLRPTVDAPLLALFASTDRRRVPTGIPNGMVSVTMPGLATSRVSTRLGDEQILVTLTVRSGRWLVTGVGPET